MGDCFAAATVRDGLPYTFFGLPESSGPGFVKGMKIR